jgi:hypothetical protein
MLYESLLIPNPHDYFQNMNVPYPATRGAIAQYLEATTSPITMKQATPTAIWRCFLQTLNSELHFASARRLFELFISFTTTGITKPATRITRIKRSIAQTSFAHENLDS